MTEHEHLDATPGTYALIDDAIAGFRGRTLIAGTEVVDFLLDLRLALAASLSLEALLEPIPA